MKKICYEQLGETLYQQVLPNGLTVAVVPRKGFSGKLAYFVTDFGSVHRNFTYQGKTWQVPAGTAHFLEHKMFDLPGRDVSAEFARMGASTNAFTSYDMTAYYFSCTEHFEENLKLLLEFVSTPYFTEESIRKEQGIIDQEIGMNLDSPDSQVFERLMPLMYRHHPVGVPILGSSQSIRELTPEILNLCHHAFYTPANMMLCVVGDVDPEQVCSLCTEMLPEEPAPVGVKTDFEQEELDRPFARTQRQMEVAMPTFEMGFRCQPAPRGMESFRQEVVGDLAAEALFGESSPLYLRLYEQGIIDSSFGGGYESLDGCAMLLCSGDSFRIDDAVEAILEEGGRIAREGIPEADFMRMKRSAMGRRLKDLDSFDSTCFRLCAYHFSGADYLRFPQVYSGVQMQDIQDFLARTVCRQRCALSVINPQEVSL